MALIKEVRGKQPQFGKDCYLAENATVVGDVVMGDRCSVWFTTVVRGDVHTIRVGDEVNIQDGAIIHCTFEKSPTTIGNRVSIGHRAIVHGCTLHDHVLIGMGAIVMDDAVIGENSIIAAGAIVTKGTVVPPGTVWAGTPARQLKEIDESLQRGEIERIASNYHLYSSWFKPS